LCLLASVRLEIDFTDQLSVQMELKPVIWYCDLDPVLQTISRQKICDLDFGLECCGLGLEVYGLSLGTGVEECDFGLSHDLEILFFTTITDCSNKFGTVEYIVMSTL